MEWHLIFDFLLAVFQFRRFYFYSSFLGGLHHFAGKLLPNRIRFILCRRL